MTELDLGQTSSIQTLNLIEPTCAKIELSLFSMGVTVAGVGSWMDNVCVCVFERGREREKFLNGLWILNQQCIFGGVFSKTNDFQWCLWRHLTLVVGFLIFYDKFNFLIILVEYDNNENKWTLNSQSTIASLVVSSVKPMTSLRSSGVYDGISHWWWGF